MREGGRDALNSERNRRIIHRDATSVTTPPLTVLVKKSSFICGGVRGVVVRRWRSSDSYKKKGFTHLRVGVQVLELREEARATVAGRHRRRKAGYRESRDRKWVQKMADQCRRCYARQQTSNEAQP